MTMKTFPFPTLWFLIIATAALYDRSVAADNNRTGAGACLNSERLALLQFKRDLVDGANRLSSWVDSGSGSNCCNWAGIVCNNQTGHVTEIRLRGLDDNSCSSRKNFYGFDTDYEAAALQRLGGMINPSLAALKQLRYLDLSCNDFKGIEIPSFIGSFENLTYLNLSESRFSGEVPSQLGNLSALRVLSVRKLSGDEYEQTVKNLRWLSSLSSLQLLDMSGIDLREIIDWLQVMNTLPSLVELHLSQCRLPPFPPMEVNLSSLSVLDLANNDFSTSMIPGWIFGLSSLVSLDLTNCYFPGQAPAGNGSRNYCNLREISLTWNGFTGSLSDVLKGLFECETPKLESLKFASNHLSGVLPEQLGRLKNLVHLDLNNNKISGSIPDSIGNLSSLESVELGQNSISGTIPGSVGRLSSLRSLYLPMNSISGPIPDSMGNLSSLEELYLQSNFISGRIPDSLGRLSSLRWLDLSYNNLSGSVPESLGQLVNLKNLNLDDNLLTGVVTESHFVNLSSLITLRAKDNALTLRLQQADNWVPPFQLQRLDLSSWNLGPKFPSWLQSQRILFILYLRGTGISDTIPGWFQSIFSGLRYFDLSYNTLSRSSTEEILCAGKEEPKPLIYINLGYAALSGPIPDCWTRFEILSILNLRNNNLSGEIPSSLGNVSSLESLNMRDNKLSGGLPDSLLNSGSLKIIDLSGNELNESISGTLIGSGVRNLKLLSLHSNKLEGNIPKELCRLTTIQILDLADNNLSGSIPGCLNNFSVMNGKENANQTVELAGYEFIGSASLLVKSRDNTYSGILGLLTVLDLSGNNFTGNIPSEVTDLVGLRFLNLSRNQLTGRIPEKIGEMKQLESLDLSVNHLIGEIPTSMSSMHFLSSLNLSYNNLTGRIPTSTQLQSLDNSSFVGNRLCGPPLSNRCREQAPTTDSKGSDGEDDDGWDLGLAVSIVLGFMIGFSVLIGPLLVSKLWRNAYFCFWLETLNKFGCRLSRK